MLRNVIVITTTDPFGHMDVGAYTETYLKYIKKRRFFERIVVGLERQK